MPLPMGMLRVGTWHCPHTSPLLPQLLQEQENAHFQQMTQFPPPLSWDNVTCSPSLLFCGTEDAKEERGRGTTWQGPPQCPAPGIGISALAKLQILGLL